MKTFEAVINMEYELIQKHGFEQAGYKKKTLQECCEHIRKMLGLAAVVGWDLVFEIFSTDHHGNTNLINWQIACHECLSASK